MKGGKKKMGSYHEDPAVRAKRQIREMSTDKLLREREGYNAEYKRYSLQELNKRGVKTERQKTASKNQSNNQGYMFGIRMPRSSLGRVRFKGF